MNLQKAGSTKTVFSKMTKNSGFSIVGKVSGLNDSPGAYVVTESPVRLSGCKGATYINVLRGHQGT